MKSNTFLTQDAMTLKNWLFEYISRRCDIPISELSGDIPFEEFGIDSVQAIEITAELEEKFGFPVDPTALFEFNNIDLLVADLTTNPSLVKS